MIKNMIKFGSALVVVLTASANASNQDLFDNHRGRVPVQPVIPGNRQLAPLPADFNGVTYVNIHKDLQAEVVRQRLNPQQIAQFGEKHYRENGAREGRIYLFNLPADFDPIVYIGLWPDLAAGAKLMNMSLHDFGKYHYYHAGRAEGREYRTPEQIAAQQRAAEEWRALVAEGARIRAEQEALRLRQAEEQRVRDAEAARVRKEQEALRLRQIEEQRALEANLRADAAAEKAEAARVQAFRDKFEQLGWELPCEGKWRATFKEDVETAIKLRQRVLTTFLEEKNWKLREVNKEVFETLGNSVSEQINKRVVVLKEEARKEKIAQIADTIRTRYNRRMQDVLVHWNAQVVEERQAEEQQAEKAKADKKAGVKSMGKPITEGSDWVGLPETNNMVLRLVNSNGAKAFAIACNGANGIVANREALVLNDRITDPEFSKFIANKKFLQRLDLTRCTKLTPNNVVLQLLNLRHLRVLRANRTLFVDANLLEIRQVCPWINTIELVDPPVVGDGNNDNNAGPAAASALARVNHLDMAAIYARIYETIKNRILEQERRTARENTLAYMEQVRDRLAASHYYDDRGRIEQEQYEIEQSLNPNYRNEDYYYIQERQNLEQQAAQAHNLQQELALLQQLEALEHDVRFNVNRNAINARIAEIKRELKSMPQRNYAFAH